MFFVLLYYDYYLGAMSHMFVSSKSEVPKVSIKSQVTVQTNQASQVKSSQWLTSSKSSQGLIRVKSSHSIKQKQIYLCHTALFIFL